MPFLKRHDNGYWKPDGKDAEPDILLRQVGPNAFQLVQGFDYEVPDWDKTDKPYPAPPHDLTKSPEEKIKLPGASKPQRNSTDLASVPYILWWFIASHGRHTRAALLHDHLVDADDIITRRDADTVFRLALEESEVKWLRRWLIWGAVSLATNAKSWWGRIYVAVFCLFLAAFAVALLYWAFGGHRWWPGPDRWPFDSTDWWPFVGHGTLPWGEEPWLPALIVAIAGVWGGRRWLLGLFAVIVLGPPTAFVLASIAIVWVVNVVASPLVWIVSGAAFRGEPFERPDMIPRPYRHEPRPF
jgi:hypothetical protein